MPSPRQLKPEVLNPTPLSTTVLVQQLVKVSAHRFRELLFNSNPMVRESGTRSSQLLNNNSSKCNSKPRSTKQLSIRTNLLL